MLKNLGSGEVAKKALETMEVQEDVDALNADGFESKYGAQFDSRKEVVKTAHLSVDKTKCIESPWVYIYKLPFDFDRAALETELRSILGRFGEVEKSLLFRHSDFHTSEIHLEIDVFLENDGERAFLFNFHNVREKKAKRKAKGKKKSKKEKEKEKEEEMQKEAVKAGRVNYLFYFILFIFPEILTTRS